VLVRQAMDIPSKSDLESSAAGSAAAALRWHVVWLLACVALLAMAMGVTQIVQHYENREIREALERLTSTSAMWLQKLSVDGERDSSF